MIEVLWDGNKISAVCEWLLFTKDGKLDDNGEILCVVELFVHPDYRGNGMIKKMIKNINSKYSNFDCIFFARHKKYPDRPCKSYSKQQILRRGGL